LNKEQAWEYLTTIRHNARKNVRKYDPNILQEITEENKNQIDQAWM